jgi:hypothetical protein
MRSVCRGPSSVNRAQTAAWGWEAPGALTPPGASLVEVTFEPDGAVLRLRHSRLVPEAVAGHAEGWDYFLGRLTEALAHA